MKEIVISTGRITKTFSGKEVIRDCQISVERGTIYGFLGKNGAGKTTMFKLLLGFLKPTAGTATVLGMDSVKENAKILKHTGSLIEAPVFYEHLSAADNLFLHLAYMGLENMEVEPVLERVGLPGTGTQPVREFSLGMRQRLSIARAIVHKPEVLILDEPVNGLDPVGMREMRLLFRQLVDQDGITILLSSHLLSEMHYPISPKKMMSAKLWLVFGYPVAAMLLCGIVIGGAFFFSESLFPLCVDHLTWETIGWAFLSLLCHSLLAGAVALLPIWIGFFKKSIPVTIVTAVIAATILCQALSAAFSFRPVLFIVFGVAAIFTMAAVRSMFYQVEKMEV